MPRIFILTVCFLIAPLAFAKGNLADTKHNLSVTGPGQFKSKTETRLCVFCHTPHRGRSDAPLWNRRDSRHVNYDSSTMDAEIIKSGGGSALCLSCHDGTIALGDMISYRAGRFGGGVADLRQKFLKGRSNLKADLSDDHPVNILYDEKLQSIDPDLVDPVKVDLPMKDDVIQCTSCHDPHSDMIPPFLHRSTLNGELCTTCHVSSGSNWSWATSSHAVSKATPEGANPWADRKPSWQGKNVKENSCMNCHVSHNAATPARLIKDKEEKTCYRCHNGTVAQRNIQADKQKFYRHPVEQSSSASHDSARKENPLTMQLHVECEDCHNPHASRSGPPLISFNPLDPTSIDHANPPFVNGSLLGVTGIGVNGVFKDEAEYEYEVCFKCHGVLGLNACGINRCQTATVYDMLRQDGVYNLREKFDPDNPTLLSYHPVVSNDPRNNNEVPSLRQDIPLDQTSSYIYCSDCHNSDTSLAAGGVEGAGPHGSRHEGILALRYDFDPVTSFVISSGSLCFKCHSVGNLYSDESFLHRQHVLDKKVSCISCHDPHGSAVYPHLINFLTRSSVSGQTFEITGAGIYNQPTWEDNGRYKGTCYLNCHGVVHDGWTYPTSALPPLR